MMNQYYIVMQRGSYQQKNIFYGQEEADRSRIKSRLAKKLDPIEGEDQVVPKKNAPPPTNLNYSQIYSEIKLNRHDKVLFSRENKSILIEKDNQNKEMIVPLLESKKQSDKRQKLSRSIHHEKEQAKQYVPDKQIGGVGLVRQKMFSISSYDIYNPKKLVGKLINNRETKNIQQLEIKFESEEAQDMKEMEIGKDDEQLNQYEQRRQKEEDPIDVSPLEYKNIDERQLSGNSKQVLPEELIKNEIKQKHYFRSQSKRDGQSQKQQSQSDSLIQTPNNDPSQDNIQNVQQKHSSHHTNDEIAAFNIEEYMHIYEILKSMQAALKSTPIDNHHLLKQIKQYLSIIAEGGLDNIDGYDIVPHKKKIIKNALLYQRIAVVIISFVYSVGKLKEGLKYLMNCVTYATTNNLLVLKVLESGEIKREIPKNPILARSDRLVLKKNYDTIRNSNDVLLDCILKLSRFDEGFAQTFKEIIKSTGRGGLSQIFYNVLQYFAFFLCVSNLGHTVPFLAVAPNPYLKQGTLQYTLVVDVMEVFCQGTKKSKMHVFRPYTEHFLNQMSQYYEIVAFTSAFPNQIDKVIDILDLKKHIKHRLYRHHAIQQENGFFKDMERLGRNLSRVVLLDGEINLGKGTNTIVIPGWKGNKNDSTLAELCPILATIALKNLNCQEACAKIHEQKNKNVQNGIKYLNFGLNLQ